MFEDLHFTSRRDTKQYLKSAPMQKTMPINEKLIATASPDSAAENKGETDFSPYIKPATSLIIPSAVVKNTKP
uniref:Uncharacterized protein n=1 Tax=Pseudoalteromonas citrea DSM 8771 TaxID=1117314 RepID=U1KV14_9GAMM